MLQLLAPLKPGTPEGGGAKVKLDKPAVMVGSRRSAMLHLPSSTVSKAHCLLVLIRGGVYVRDLASTTGTTVNDQSVREQTMVDGDEMQVGRFRFKLIDPRPMEVDKPTTRPVALLVTKDGLGRQYKFPAGERCVLVGRRETADVSLKDSLVSAAHLALVRLDGVGGTGWAAYDLGGRGTTHNGRPLIRNVLQPRDKLQVGSHTLSLRVAEAPAVVETPPAVEAEVPAVADLQGEPPVVDDVIEEVEQPTVEPEASAEHADVEAASEVLQEDDDVEFAPPAEDATEPETSAETEQEAEELDEQPTQDEESSVEVVESPPPVEEAEPAVEVAQEEEPLSLAADDEPETASPLEDIVKAAAEVEQVQDAEEENDVLIEAVVEDEVEEVDKPSEVVEDTSVAILEVEPPALPDQADDELLELASDVGEAVGTDEDSAEPEQALEAVEESLEPAAEEDEPVELVDEPVVLVAEPEPIEGPIAFEDAPDEIEEEPPTLDLSDLDFVEPASDQEEIADSVSGTPESSVAPKPAVERAPSAVEAESAPRRSKGNRRRRPDQPVPASVKLPAAVVPGDETLESLHTAPAEPTVSEPALETETVADAPLPIAAETPRVTEPQTPVVPPTHWQADWEAGRAGRVAAHFGSFGKAPPLAEAPPPLVNTSPPAEEELPVEELAPADAPAAVQSEMSLDASPVEPVEAAPDEAANEQPVDAFFSPTPEIIDELDIAPDARPTIVPDRPARVGFTASGAGAIDLDEIESAVTGPFSSVSFLEQDATARQDSAIGSDVLDPSFVIPETSGLTGFVASPVEAAPPIDVEPPEPEAEVDVTAEPAAVAVEPLVTVEEAGGFLRTVREGVAAPATDADARDEAAPSDFDFTSYQAQANGKADASVSRPAPRRRPSTPPRPQMRSAEDLSLNTPKGGFWSRMSRGSRAAAVLAMMLVAMAVTVVAIQRLSAPLSTVKLVLPIETPANLPASSLAREQGALVTRASDGDIRREAVSILQRRTPGFEPGWLLSFDIDDVYPDVQDNALVLSRDSTDPAAARLRLHALGMAIAAADSDKRAEATQLDERSRARADELGRKQAEVAQVEADLAELRSQQRQQSADVIAGDPVMLRTQIRETETERGSMEAKAARARADVAALQDVSDDAGPDGRPDEVLLALRARVEQREDELSPSVEAELQRQIELREAELEGERQRAMQDLRRASASALAGAERLGRRADDLRLQLATVEDRLAADLRLRSDIARLVERRDALDARTTELKSQATVDQVVRSSLVYALPPTASSIEVQTAEDKRMERTLYALLGIFAIGLLCLYLVLRRPSTLA